MCFSHTLFFLTFYTFSSVLFFSFLSFIFFHAIGWQEPIKQRNQPSIPLLFSSVALTHIHILREFVGITLSSLNRFNFHVIDIVCTFFFDTSFYKKEKRRREGQVSFSLFPFLFTYICMHTHTHRFVTHASVLIEIG